MWCSGPVIQSLIHTYSLDCLPSGFFSAGMHELMVRTVTPGGRVQN